MTSSHDASSGSVFMVSVALSRMFVSGVLLILFAPVLQLSPKRSPEAIADDLLKSPLTAAVTERRRKIFHFEMLREPQDVTLPKSRLRLALMLLEDLQHLLNRTVLCGPRIDGQVRTRMYGGVGTAVSNGGGYSISGIVYFDQLAIAVALSGG